jgi:hypothetical protein
MAFGNLADSAAEMFGAEGGQAPVAPAQVPAPPVTQQAPMQPQPATPDPGVQQEQQAVEPQVTEETLGNIDPATLPPELKVLYNSMLGDYRRKTTEVAQLRNVQQQLASLGITTPEQIAEYAQYSYRMERDPQFALQVANRVNELHGTPVAPAPANNPAQPNYAPEFNDVEETPDEYLSRIEALEQRYQQDQTERARDQMAQKLSEAERNIGGLHPDYGPNDWAAIYELLPSMGYDLYRANDRYIDIQAGVAQRLLASRANPNPALTHPVGSIPTQQTNELGTLRDASTAAVEMMKAAGDWGS